MKALERWNLDCFFKADELIHFLSEIKNLLEKIETAEQLKDRILSLDKTMKYLSDALAYVSCLMAEDVSNTKAVSLKSQISDLYAKLENSQNQLSGRLAAMQEADFEKLLSEDELIQIAFSLREMRQQIKEKLEIPQEKLISDLSVEGYHSWNQLYKTLVGQTVIPLDKETSLSWAQLDARLSSPDRSLRQKLFYQSSRVWEKQQGLFAQLLNNLAGFRLKTYQHRGWQSFLKEPLEKCRMNSETLEMMWEVIHKNKSLFISYMQQKAKLLGLEKLSWYDLQVPLSSTIAPSTKLTFQDAAEFIVKEFQKVSPKMSAFAKMALEEGWVEAEDRAGKMPGGFCVPFLKSQQSRIFMTFTGSRENMITLAHELGHAFHSHVLNGLPALASEYPMNLAESASTLAEFLVLEGSLLHETNDKQKLSLLDSKIQRSLIFMMNIHARFLFEKMLYQERRKGHMTPEHLSALMVQAQKQAFLNSLEEYNPYFWISKEHFYITSVPFYNFPYTFGYFFSLGIYAQLGKSVEFENKYLSLLRDTGVMAVEDLAKKHLNEDLSLPHFWQKSVDLAKKDVTRFLEISK